MPGIKLLHSTAFRPSSLFTDTHKHTLMFSAFGSLKAQLSVSFWLRRIGEGYTSHTGTIHQRLIWVQRWAIYKWLYYCSKMHWAFNFWPSEMKRSVGYKLQIGLDSCVVSQRWFVIGVCDLVWCCSGFVCLHLLVTSSCTQYWALSPSLCHNTIFANIKQDFE